MSATLKPPMLQESQNFKGVSTLGLGSIELLDRGGNVLRSWTVRRPQCSIGSGAESNVRIEGAELSPIHVQLTFGRRHVVAQSKVGFWVSGRLVREWLFDASTDLDVGACIFRITPVRAMEERRASVGVTPSKFSPQPSPPPTPTSGSTAPVAGSRSGDRDVALQIDTFLPSVEKVVQELVAPLRGAMEELKESVQVACERSSAPLPVEMESPSKLWIDQETLGKMESQLSDKIEAKLNGLMAHFERLHQETLQSQHVAAEVSGQVQDRIQMEELLESQRKLVEFELQLQRLREERDQSQWRVTELSRELEALTRSAEHDQEVAKSISREQEGLIEHLTALDAQLHQVQQSAEQNASQWHAANQELQDQLTYWQSKAHQLETEISEQKNAMDVAASPSRNWSADPDFRSNQDSGESNLGHESQPLMAPSEVRPSNAGTPITEWNTKSSTTVFSKSNVLKEENGPAQKEPHRSFVEGLGNSAIFPARMDLRSAPEFDDEHGLEDPLGLRFRGEESADIEAEDPDQQPKGRTEETRENFDPHHGFAMSLIESLKEDVHAEVEGNSDLREHGSDLDDGFEIYPLDDSEEREPFEDDAQLNIEESAASLEDESFDSPFGSFRQSMDEVRTDRHSSDDSDFSVGDRLDFEKEDRDQLDQQRDVKGKVSPLHDDESIEEPFSDDAEPMRQHDSRFLQDSRGSAEPEEEESIEDYMQQLLKRVRGTSDSTRSSVSLSKLNSQSPPSRKALREEPNPVPSSKATLEEMTDTEAKPKSSPISKPKTSAPYSPRQNAPEKNRDMAAMRELANSTARKAIERSDRRRLEAELFFKCSVTIIGLLGGIFLLVVNGFRPNMALVGAVAGFIVAGWWGWESVALMRVAILQSARTPQVSEQPRALESDD